MAAMATIDLGCVECKGEIRKSKVKFKAPAGRFFCSLICQSNFFMKNNWSNWNSKDEPRSYLIPPIFRYKNFDKSREDILQNDREAMNYFSDEAEHIVYKIIDRLRQNRNISPFIAVQSWDIEKRKQDNMENIFPGLVVDDIMKHCFREHDFILIGPKIGIVVIEVKYPSYDKGNNRFYPNGMYKWPKTYEEGLDQLKRARNLLHFLQKCTAYPDSTGQLPTVSTVLCTPNLEMKNYNEWLQSLNSPDQDKVKEKVDKTMLLFKKGSTKEEIENQLYLDLKQFLEERQQISNEMYQAYAPIIAAFGSIIILQNKQIDVNKEQLSEKEAVHRTTKEITKLNPVEIIFLSANQGSALISGPRQFIIGTAGTGKTILLQEKAKQLLEKGQPVTILAPESYAWLYKSYFDKEQKDQMKFDKYKILHWSEEKFQGAFNMIKKMGKTYEADEKMHSKSDVPIQIIVASFLAEDIVMNKDVLFEDFKWLLGSDDHIIIDDAVDVVGANVYPVGSLCFYFFIMMLAENRFPLKTVWIAIDPYQPNDEDSYSDELRNLFFTDWNWSDLRKKCSNNWFSNMCLRFLNSLSGMEEKNKSNYFSVMPLKKVMRCSANIFEVYDNLERKTLLPTNLQPEPGHNIQGIVREINDHKQTLSLARLNLWEKVKEEIEIEAQGNNFKNVAILVLGWPWPCYLYKYIRQQCKECWPNGLKSETVGIKIAELLPDTKLLISENVLTVEHWDKVSSLEWRAVICVDCIEKGSAQSNRMTQNQYRAVSRAMTKLIIITVTFNTNDLYEKDRNNVPNQSDLDQLEQCIL